MTGRQLIHSGTRHRAYRRWAPSRARRRRRRHGSLISVPPALWIISPPSKFSCLKVTADLMTGARSAADWS